MILCHLVIFIWYKKRNFNINLSTIQVLRFEWHSCTVLIQYKHQLGRQHTKTSYLTLDIDLSETHSSIAGSLAITGKKQNPFFF